MWQDSLLSLCYDRPPIVSTRGWIPEAKFLQTELSYLNLMRYLCWIALKIIQMDGSPESEPTQNLALLAELDNTYNRAQLHLLRREDCKNLQQHLEHLALRMHVSFCVSALCRPAIRSSPQNIQDTRYVSLRSRARVSLIDASKTFLEFQALSIVPSRTWSMVHTVLSSMLLLSTWQETKEDPECRDLQQKVIEVFSSGNPSGKDTGSSEYSQWLSARHIKALITLRQALKQRAAPQASEGNELDMNQAPEVSTNYGVHDASQDMPWMDDFSSYNNYFPGLGYG